MNNTKNSLHFKGEIDNVTSLIFDDGDAAKTNLEMFSDRIIWKDFFAMFKAIKKIKTELMKKGKRCF